MNYVSGLLSNMYGSSLGLGNAGTAGTPSSSVLARVEQTMAAQRGVAAKLNANINSSQARLSGLGQLQAALSQFQDVAERLAGTGLSTRASTSSTGVLGVATNGKAEPGSHTVKVSQLAQQQILISPEAQTPDTPLGTGSPTVIRIGSGDSSKSITIDSRNNTLQGIAEALKNAGFDASLVRSSTGTSLQLRSASGEASALKISVAGDATVRQLFNGMEQTQAAQDALLTVNGKAIRSADNSIESAIAGTTLNLTGKGETTVTIARDNGQIAKNVESFVSGFNALQDRLGALQKGALKGNQALTQVSAQLGDMVRNAGSNKETLANAGISFDDSGRIKLDKDKLTAAIANDAEGVAKLFTNEGRGLADALGKRLEALGGERSVVSRAMTQADREVDTLQDRKAKMAQALTLQAQALVRMYSQEEQGGGTSSLLDLLA
ncbi:flagellar filament capping protein FliD [Pseudoduganella sp. DS3]|uniref:Flagellar hook-associated protein 2 n=1 Tax=Pseudoduganella guangdongensis TaxID=2692179 RepID=A0A6N9HF62_9BURK|nr:flagellar filament capping protein FliD [Pseudoduganella guangdongensis]MYN02218.1 flagellar filament capping protein FliD [Pseudoduganella guangdongensis]